MLYLLSLPWKYHFLELFFCNFCFLQVSELFISFVCFCACFSYWRLFSDVWKCFFSKLIWSSVWMLRLVNWSTRGPHYRGVWLSYFIRETPDAVQVFFLFRVSFFLGKYFTKFYLWSSRSSVIVLRRTFGDSLSVCCLFSASYTISALYSPSGSSSSPKNKPPVLSCRERTPHFHLSWKVRQWIYKKHDCFLNRLSNNASDLTLSHLHPSFRVHLTPQFLTISGVLWPKLPVGFLQMGTTIGIVTVAFHTSLSCFQIFIAGILSSVSCIIPWVYAIM